MTSTLYHLAVLGAPSPAQAHAVEEYVRKAIEAFGLQFGREVSWQVGPTNFEPAQQLASAAVFFGGVEAPLANVVQLLDRGVPVLPVASALDEVGKEIPAPLRPFNCLGYDTAGASRVATALLECVGMLPRERRVFLSYKREESRAVALQLFDELSARQFDVFLDTHGVAAGEDFQAILWHRLCDSDVLVMLDTPTYFSSRWTSAEFGRALAKGIAVLRIAWPDSTPSPRTATASRVELLTSELDESSGRLNDEAIARICFQLEAVRSQSHAVRYLNLTGSLRNAIEQIGGSISGRGLHKSMNIRLSDGRDVVAFPTVGVPTSLTLHSACANGTGRSVAVVYDHVGMREEWIEHLNWLGGYVHTARWVKSSEAAWQFADWEG